MADSRLLSPETFCDIAEAVEHAEALLALLQKVSDKPYSEAGCFNVAACDLVYRLETDLKWLRGYIEEDIEASQETT